MAVHSSAWRRSLHAEYGSGRQCPHLPTVVTCPTVLTVVTNNVFTSPTVVTGLLSAAIYCPPMSTPKLSSSYYLIFTIYNFEFPIHNLSLSTIHNSELMFPVYCQKTLPLPEL